MIPNYITPNQLRTIYKLNRELGNELPYISMTTSVRDASKMIADLERQAKQRPAVVPEVDTRYRGTW